jgi:Flp pilus assembly protein TadG
MDRHDPHLLRSGTAPGLGQSRPPRQAGAAMIEAVLMAPVLVLAAMFALAGGKLGAAQIDVNGAAHAAARAATLERVLSSAEAAAYAAAETGTGSRCSQVSIALDGDLTPGSTITVTLTCTVADTGMPVLDGRTLTATAASPVDQWRGGET